MANYRAVANGNWSSLATWQDDSLGYFNASTVLPTSADDVYSNNFTVTIDGVRNARLITNNAFSPPTFLGAMSIPQMGSDTTPSGVASASFVLSGPAWQAFDRNTATFWQGGLNTGWLSYQFPTGKIIKRYAICTTPNNNNRPTSWTFQGSNNGSSWTTIDSQTFTLALGAFTSFDISSNVTSYLYYRINILSVQGVNNNVQIASLEMSEITNLYTGTTAGGGFTFANGGDLTCAALNGVVNRDVGSVYCLTFDLPSPSAATLRASTSTAGSVANGRNILVQNTGTFNMVGDYGIQAFGFTNRATIFINGTTTINIIGNITNSSNISAQIASTLWVNAGIPTINITGNVTGGSPNTFTAGNGNAIYSTVASTINITGNVTTNSSPSIFLGAGGTLNVMGDVTGGSGFSAIYSITVAHSISVTGTVTASQTSSAIIMTNANSQVYLNGNMVNVNGRMAIFAPIVWLDRTGTTSAAFFTSGGGNRTLYSANTVPNTPAASNVRLGTIYGAGNSLAGTLAMPVAADTSSGVVYDNGTTGTALFTTDTLLSELNSSSDPVAVRIRNAATPQVLGKLMEAYKK